MVLPSVLVICKSAELFCVSVSLAVLFPGVGSVTPVGVFTDAGSVKLPVKLLATDPVTV